MWLEFSGHDGYSRSSGGVKHLELECPGSDWRTGVVCHGVEFDFWCFLLFETI